MDDKEPEFDEEDEITDDDLVCPYCRGTGYVNPLTARPAQFCVGTTDCEACDGSGYL